MEANHRASLSRAFLATISNPKLNPLVVVDATHHKISHFQQLYNAAVAHGYDTYVAHIDGTL